MRVPKLIKNFLAYYGILKILTTFRNSPLDLILSRMNPLHIHMLSLLTYYFIITIQSTPLPLN
jgi:hypothetical protein